MTRPLLSQIQYVTRLIISPFERFLIGGGNQYAGNAAYFAFVAIFPFFILLTHLAVAIRDVDAVTTFIDVVFQALPSPAVVSLKPAIEDLVTRESASLVTLSLLGALWVSLSFVEALRSGLDHAYGFDRSRSFLFRRLQGLFLVLILMAAILATMTLAVLEPIADAWIGTDEAGQAIFTGMIDIGRLLVAPVLLLVLVCALYRYLPNYKQKWLDVLPGGVVSTVLWFALAAVLGEYFKLYNNMASVYGNLGGIVALLLFFYLCAAAFFIGAYVNAVLSEAGLLGRKPQ